MAQYTAYVTCFFPHSLDSSPLCACDASLHLQLGDLLVPLKAKSIAKPQCDCSLFQLIVTAYCMKLQQLNLEINFTLKLTITLQ